MKSLSVFLFTTFLVAAPLTAQPVVQDEIVVTASALPERADETPATVTVITREEIDERAARDVSDVLREVPGLSVARIGSSGHQTTIFTRGANGAHTLVLWNGIEVSPPFFGGSSGFDWGQFSTAGVEQIEVVRGPFSALYGSEAVAGVINVLTVPSRSGVQASAEGGEGLFNAQAYGSYVQGNLALSGSFESRRDDGFAANDDFDQHSANAALRWTTASQLGLGIRARYNRYALGVPLNLNFELDELVSSPLRRQDGDEWQVAVPIDQTIGTFSYDVVLSESRREDLLEDPGDPFGPFCVTTDSRSRRGRLVTRTKTAAIGTLVAGAEYETISVDDVTNFGPNFLDKKRTERSLFLEDRYSAAVGSARLELSAGARYDDYETFGSEVSPRVAAAWIAGGNKFHAAYGEAFRAPYVGELFSPFGGNPDLRAERSRSFEAGAAHFFTNGEVALTLFHDRYRDLITNAGFVLANVGRARARGAELSAQSRISNQVNGGLTYTYTDAENLDTDEPLLRRPKHSGSAFVSVRQGIAQVNLVLLRTGARPDILPVLPFSRTTNEAHTTLDVNVQFDLGRFTPYLKVENLTDVKYEEILGYASPSRRAIVGIRVR
ncbi:MAG TPA: TonB-dependent receptor [Thermoanaerobaculia bacterium]|jgi:vitamin B12 transporter